MRLHVGSVVLLVLGITCAACKKVSSPQGNPAQPIYRVNGQSILHANGQTIQLKGVAFGNEVWSDREIPSTHHQEVDYQRVKDMGMNTIRFYLNYKTFEDDRFPYQYKSAGWDWVDQNITWAKRHGIYLILNMHVPQ